MLRGDPRPPRIPRWREAIEAAQKGWTAHLLPDPLAFADDDPVLDAWLDDIRRGAYVWLVVERPAAD